MEIEDIEKPIKLDLINIDTGSQELNENMIRNNQILLEIITNSNTSDIREDFQATFKYISAKLPSQVRVPFKGTTMRVFRGGHKFLCGCPDNRIVICNKKEILYDYKTNERVTAIEICENDQYGIIACDFILKKFDLGTFEVVASYLGHLDKITAIVMSQDEKDIYSSSWDSSVRLSHNGSQTSNKSEIVYTHSSRVLSLSISRDGTHLISGGLDQEIMLFNIPNKKVERVLISPKPFVSCVKFSPKKTYFATSDISFNINIWKFESLSIIKILDGHTDKIRSMKFRTDESVLVTGSKDTNVRV